MRFLGMARDNFLPFVSILVLNYNNKKWLKNCLKSLASLKYPKSKYEVIMADNGSTDDSIQFVKKHFPWVNIVRFDKNYGFAEGNNRAARYAKGEYIAFLNPDTKVDKNWIIESVKVVHGNPKIACCGGKVLFFNQRDVIQNAGHKFTLIGFGYPIGFGEKNCSYFEFERLTAFASGCSVIIKKETFFEVGGFDSDYFMYVEEADFGLRLWIYGYKVMYTPKAITYHALGGSFQSETIPLHVFNQHKNMLITIMKNFELRHVFIGLFIASLYNIYKIVEFSRSKRPDFIIALIKGDYHFLRQLPKTMTKRRIIQKNRVIRDKDLLKLGLIANPLESIREILRLRKLALKWDGVNHKP